MKRATTDRSRKPAAGRRRRRPGAAVVLAGSVGVLAALWLIYWYGANRIGDAVLDRIAAAAAVRGFTAECANHAGGGFPLSVDLTCSRASLGRPDGGLIAALDGLSATTPLYRPGRIEWAARGPLVVDLPASRFGLTARWQTAESTLDAGPGGLVAAAARVEGLRLELPASPDRSPFGSASLASADLSLSPDSDDGYRVTAAARAVAFTGNDGATLPAIDAEAELTALAFGDTLGLDPPQALRDWLAGGGTVRIDELAVTTDTVMTSGSGTLAVSPDGMLSGDLDVTIAGIEALPDLVEAFRPDAREQAAQIVAAVVAFTRPVELASGPARRMTLLVRDGVVSIGIVPIGVIPPIRF